MSWDMGGFSLGFDPQLDSSFLNQYSSVPDYSYSIPDLQLSGGQMPAPSYSLGANTQLDSSGISSAPYGGFGVSPLSFNPATVGAPAPGGPAPAPVGSLPAGTSSSATAPTTLGGVQGAGDRGGPATTTPGISSTGSNALQSRSYTPGSQSTGTSDAIRSAGSPYYSSTPGVSGMASPAQSIQSTMPPAQPPSRWGQFGKDLLRSGTSSGVQALIGGGLSLLGSALAPKPQQQRGPAPMGGGSTPASSPAPSAPATPLPGAQWSPLLMKQPMMSGNPNIGLEVQRRMRRGGNTGGMTMF